MATFVQEMKTERTYSEPAPTWELYAAPRGGRRGQGEFLSVSSGGAIRFSKDAYKGLLGEPSYIEVYLDRRSGFVGLRPTTDPEKSYKVSSGQSISIKTLVSDLGLEKGRYSLRADIGGLVAFNPATDKIS